MLVKRKATYKFVEGEGHLYVVDKLLAEQLSGGVTDLAVVNIEGGRSRIQAQKAWLLGPLGKTDVPPECLTAYITAKRSIFRDYAIEEGLINTDSLFPSTRDDTILRILLELPWKMIEEVGRDLGIPFFRPALDIPEYHGSFTKIATTGMAFYRGARVADFGSIDGDRYGGIIVRVPEVAFFGEAGELPLRFPKVLELLSPKQSVAFEVNELFHHVGTSQDALYQKGVVAMMHDSDLIELCELFVRHPGLEMTGAGIGKGWFYRVGHDGVWRHEKNVDQCNCGNSSVHLRHISTLHIVEDFLASPEKYDGFR
jgi:hypothetical protein